MLLSAFILLIPALAFSDSISFKVGYFFPRASSDLWEIEFENLDLKKSNFQDNIFGFNYDYFLSNQLSLSIGLDGYSQKKLGTYMGYVSDIVDEDLFAFDYGQGNAVSHVFTVSMTPIHASLKIAPMGRKGNVIPYVGAGGDVILWTMRIQGQMIDFSDPVEFYDTNLNKDVTGYPVIDTDARVENKISIGWHIFGGVMVPLGRQISLEGEFKYTSASGDISEAFVGFENFDLSGYQITIGINYWF
jgi:opacity protein-like surface antigen